ncbi:MAG: Maf family nucleotide pyrophosphatase, partial [Rikenellaceae bacterium]|nr:Maf family nucleotide pyrophosphatase [Rikenellaceae bacterium]
MFTEGSKLHIILASGSPRRRELVAGCGLRFTVADRFGVDERYPASLPPHEVPLYLARLKSAGYPLPLATDDVLVTADTVVILDGQILGKPAGRDDAVAMLARLSGRQHSVVTGVVARSAVHEESFSERTEVWFDELAHGEIEYYVDRYRPFDKAGSYGVQEWIGYVAIRRIEGSFYNVMGLPIATLY